MSAESLNTAQQPDWYAGAMEQLVDVVQDLSHARTLESVMEIVRVAARKLTSADGATFVLRDGDLCHYADENAISPLWKGQRFPMRICISGWVMLHAEQVVIEDIYADPRIPAEAYRPTFVKSMAMVPIRMNNPIGAIGNYWATHRKPTQQEVAILQALANITAVTLENVNLYNDLQHKIRALETSNDELNRFAWIASHDLKSPLRAINNLSQWIEEDFDEKLYDKSREHLSAMRGRVKRMETLLDDLLEYAQIDRIMEPPKPIEMVSGTDMFENILALVDVPAGFTVKSDGSFDRVMIPRLPVQQVLCNLVNNAIKHHDKPNGQVMISALETEMGYIISVTDDGPGIDPQYNAKIFEMFQTLQPRDKNEGSGMGLALVKKMLKIYGSEIGVKSEPGKGAMFSFTWPKYLQIQETANA